MGEVYLYWGENTCKSDTNDALLVGSKMLF